MERIIIYYFSGSGNSLAVALSLAEKLSCAKVESVMNLHKSNIIPSDYQRVGFVYPCCYGHPPRAVTEAVSNIMLGEEQKVFAVVTFGGFYGHGLTDVTQLLKNNPENQIQGFSVRMPGSHILGYSAYPDLIQRFLFHSEDKRIGKIAERIKNDTPTRFKKAMVIEKAARAVSGENDKKTPLFGEMGTLFYATDNCGKCGACAKICPMENISISEEQVNWGNKCQQCMACIQWCPNHAIAYPNIPLNRRRYHHPRINLQKMLEYRKPD